MPVRSSCLLLAASLSACAAGAPALEYAVPEPGDVRYIWSDTSTVGVSLMGQSVEMAQRATAEYAISFTPAPAGVNVTMSLSHLEGVLTQPMGAPVRVDEDDVEGVLVFALDREGNPVIAERPTVAVNASQMVSGLVLAHHFFPASMPPTPPAIAAATAAAATTILTMSSAKSMFRMSMANSTPKTITPT